MNHDTELMMRTRPNQAHGRPRQTTDPLPGARLRTLRERASLTQEALAQLAGVTRNRISHYENGAVQIGAVVGRRLAAALECSLDELIGGAA